MKPMTLEEFKQYAAAALTSGKYRQGFGWLKHWDKGAGEVCHCAEGAIAEEAGFPSTCEAFSKVWSFSFDGRIRTVDFPYGLVPITVQKRIWEMNDKLKASFGEINEYIQGLTEEDWDPASELAEYLEQFEGHPNDEAV